MTHSLHRRGKTETLYNDFVILVTPAVGINHADSGPKLWKVLDIITEVQPDNIGSYETGTIFTGVSIEEIKASMPETPRVRCCFDSKEKMCEVIKRIYALNLGLSVVISGLNDEILDMTKQLGIKPHSVHYSLGIFGKKDLLPSEDVLDITTMCGHSMISEKLVLEMIRQVRSGKLTPMEAAQEIAKPCVCGIFNVVRASELLEKQMTD